MRKNLKAFTLIELLIVVAIIAILAAIAVPNFLEAQVRSKVSREKANMRSLATALESYRVDNTKYPMDAWFWAFQPMIGGIERPDPLGIMTTPVAYMTRIPENVFYNKRKDQIADPFNDIKQRQYDYASETSSIPQLMEAVDLSLGGYDIPAGRAPRAQWALASIGPDKLQSSGGYLVYGEDIVNNMKPYIANGVAVTTYGAIYDPTNGTMSIGDIVRIGP